MANYTQTIKNQVSVVGPSTPELWGQMVWGVDPWGEDGELDLQVGKGVSNTVTPTSAFAAKYVTKVYVNSTNLTTATAKHVVHVFTNDLPVVSTPIKQPKKVYLQTLLYVGDMTSEQVGDGLWARVFIKPTTNAEQRTTATFTAATGASTTYTERTEPTTNWS